VDDHQIPTLNPEAFFRRNYKRHQEASFFHSSSFESFEIHRIEEHKNYINFPLLPHRKTIHDFIFLTSGSIIRSKGLSQYEIKKHSFFFLPAFQITTTKYVSDDAAGFYCHFDSSLISNARLLDNSFLQPIGHPTVTLTKNNVLPIKNLLTRLMSINGQDSIALIDAYLSTLLVELRQIIAQTPNPIRDSAHHITEQFKGLLSQNIYQIHKVADFASLLNITPNHLNKSVKKITGKTANDCISEMTLLEAKVLLKQTQLTIAEIAFALLQRNPSDFSRFFKQKTGLTPKQYREST
jgi:AraC-like DNA-binding protein